ncbi:MAG: hypothetical protein WA373_08565 [Burkholderiales bacterium]
MPNQEPTASTPGWIVSRVLTPLYNGWNWLREWLLALKPCRFSLLMVIAGLVFLIVAPQGQDVLRALAEQQSGNRDAWQRFFFFAGALAWSLYAWHWARVMLSLSFPGVPENDRRLQGFRVWVPRLIGFAATFGVAVALNLASRGYADGEQPEVQRLLREYAFWCLLGSVAFLIAAALRRPLFRAAHRKLKGLTALQGRFAAPAVNMLAVRSSAEEVFGSLDFADLTPLTRWLLYGALAAAVLLFAIFVFAAQASAPVVGSAAILLFAATGWIAVGSALDFIGMRLRFPVFLALLVLAVVFSRWNDNHAVRTLPDPQLAAGQREDLRGALRSWMSHQRDRPAGDKGQYPMYLVNAEGGGIRAAYWTVTVLGEIQKRNPCFADRLFSLSGVSGGSLGASVFVALLVEQRAADGALSCGAGAASPGRLDVKSKAQEILSEDFLSPVVAAMLYPDLTQRLLFWPVERFDRALALEQAWERAWRLHMPGTDRFAQPMDRLWDNTAHWTPALFLNATWVETGKRLIASNVRIAAPDANAAEDFVDTEDAQRFFAPRSLALSTAAHMSARFTYVSPAGTLVRDGKVHGRVVDGGYFENSGATTTLEILKTLPSMEKEDKRWAKVEPIVIHISNEPVDPSAGADTLQAAPENRNIAPHGWLNEVMSPLWTLLNTRGARGVYARETVHWHVDDAHFLHFGLCRRSANVPLGWVLSQSTRARMESQLLKEPCSTAGTPSEVIFDNPGNLERIDARLSQPTPTHSAQRDRIRVVISRKFHSDP